MMKRILLCLMLLASVIAKGAITPADNQMWWGYFGNTDLFGMSDGGIGTSAGSTLSVAIMIPAGETMVGNSTIKAIRFWLGSSVTAISDDLITELSIVGGLLIMASGITILKLKDCKTLNLLPALFVPILFFLFRGLFLQILTHFIIK